MKNIFLFGDSYVHGTGGPQGGWADKIKLSLHRDLYGEDATDGNCYVYGLGLPGATTTELLDRFEPELQVRLGTGSAPSETVIVLQSGTNDAKAVGSPEGYITTPEGFEQTAQALLVAAQKYADCIIVLGLPPVDERKVRPKHNPITGNTSYSSNGRLKQFEAVWQAACNGNLKTVFIPLHTTVPEAWIDRYLYTDGMHPNDQGYQWIANQLEPQLRSKLGDL